MDEGCVATDSPTFITGVVFGFNEEADEGFKPSPRLMFPHQYNAMDASVSSQSASQDWICCSSETYLSTLGTTSSTALPKPLELS